MIPNLPVLHGAMLEKIVAAMPADARFEALLGTGSMAYGGFDEESDLDLLLLVRPDMQATVMAERRAFAAGMGDLLACFTGEHVGEPRLLICLYGPPPLHVDLKFVAANDPGSFAERPLLLWARDPGALKRRIEELEIKPAGRTAQWFEDRTWLWLHYSATKLRRGELFEAMSGLDFFRDVVLGPMLRRNAGERPRGLRRIETRPGARDRLLPTLARYDRVAIAWALRGSVALYMELRAADPPPAPTAHMPQALLDFIDAMS
ncbi:MAG: nucleotidyltransferase domain-containing protein [Reyranella sp.]|nr:nucleotidyltransferase domain-containing protein [Reyranella sp.]